MIRNVWKITTLALIVILVVFLYVDRHRIKEHIGSCYALGQTESVQNYPPQDCNVLLDSTNLPIVFVNTKRIERNCYTEAQIKIIDNGSNEYNYCDTIVHPDQNINYSGPALIKYHGHSSFLWVSKKSYAIRILDKPLDKGGKKISISLLGLQKGKKYVLNAQHFDRSMLRNALINELARPFFDYIPSTRYCEVILNGTYYGLFQLTEQPDRRRLRIKKGKDSGGCILYYSREDEADRTIATELQKEDTLFYSYKLKYPDKEDVDSISINCINTDIDSMVRYIVAGNGCYKDYIDENSLIDYQLITEFSHNTDGYWWCMYLYRQNKSSPFKMILWDNDHTIGIGCKPGFAAYDNWVYSDVKHPIKMRNQQKGPQWWYHYLMKQPAYCKRLSDRWTEYRSDVYSSEYINQLVDSLCYVLTSGGAIERNNQAWKIWDEYGSTPLGGHIKYLSDSHADEIQYIKDWIDKRLNWMDKQLNNDERPL